MLANLLARMRAGGLQQANDHWVLDENDGSYAYAIVAGSVRKVVIVIGDGSASVDGVKSVHAQIPDFVSGVVEGGIIPNVNPPATSKMESFWPTAACARLHGMEEIVQPSARLAVNPYNPFLDQLGYKGLGNFTYSQMALLKPTMYSGMMRKVVQFLMGFGRQIGVSIYDKTKPIIKEPAPPPTPHGNPDANLTRYQKDVKDSGRQIRFDWRFVKTHGITKASDGTLWIVEIGSSRGVLAFRLPVHELTRDPLFRKKLERLGDSAGLYALDALGAWPTGESIPTTAIDSWKRAGLVLTLATPADLQPFYENGAFSMQMGWAFSPDGREAHNTCNGWDGDMQNAQHHAVDISIGAFREITPASNAKALKAKFRSMIDRDGYKDRYPAVMAKIDRMERRDCDTYLHRDDPADVLFDALDAIVLDPCASGKASRSLVSKSPLYYPGKYQPMIKFPWPELGYLLSHDMRSTGPVADTRCNATVHVFWAQGELKYVRYFRDPRPAAEGIHTDDFEECMWVGEWHSHDESGPNGISPQMYTNDFDNRIEKSENTSDTTVTSKDYGYYSVYVQDDLVYPPRSWVYRAKRFLKCSKTTVVSGFQMGAVVTVPFFDRCSYYHSTVVSSTSTTVFGGCRFDSLNDPWFCENWRNFYPWTHNVMHPDGCCICTARTVISPGGRYSPGPCSDFADSGPWCFTCDNADALCYVIPEPPTPTIQSENYPFRATRDTYLVNDTDFSPVHVEHLVDLNSASAGGPWFVPSPDPDSQMTQYLDSTHNAFGTAQALKYYAQHAGPIRTLGGPFPPNYDGENITFIGVVP